MEKGRWTIEWYESFFWDQTTADKRRELGLKKVQTRPQTPEWMRKNMEETDARVRMAKKTEVGPPMRKPSEGWKKRVVLEEALLGLTVYELYELEQKKC